ncbi:MAG: hypothetical protein JGK24_28105 [Microcoleus sp. PH2017_29_MFU_D_A]|uniref:hypothetical protein n=1 Tax=Microcoleus sp. PH2017_29_MFU_D_A TaxID=2798839 RepID=UPI001D5FC1E5|nr:hypothetical protein [Microcoleus sp. PH2017_29_MFU_D_A]MCC3606982.1 hypothetical protein [Microcoleus sp. PH2017_29_MFU_D_A]
MAQDQRVEFLFAAQVSGQEQLQKLISSVDSLRKETEQLKSANAGLASSTDAVIRNGVRYNNAIDAQSKALRQARQGTQQLGMQINDFATSVSTGASPVQAFNQQIGQVGIALSQMGGKLGVVGGFLAGPWGAALVIATMVLAPFIENMFGASEAAKELQESEMGVRDSSIAVMFAKAELDKALGRNTDSYKQASAAALQAGLDDLKSAKDFLTASMARLATAKKESQLMNQFRAIGGVGGGFLAGVADLMGYGDVQNATVETNKAVKALNIETENVLKTLAAREKLLKSDQSSRTGSAGRAVATIKPPKLDIKKEKPAFYMLGFYEEFFAEEFKQNDKSLAKVAEDQINSLLSTVPAMAKMSDEMAQIISRNEELNNSFDAIGQSVSNSFKGMLTGAMSFKDAMKGIIGAVIDELWKLFVVQQIVGVVKSAMGSVFGVKVPAKAIGGSVGKNRPYMVGEQGPELFIPGGSGTIIPNRNLSSNGGGSNFNISVDARGATDPAAVRAQVQQGILEAAPAIIAAAESRTIAGLRRPRLGGAMQ